MSKKIVVTINSIGEVTFDAQGYKGTECLKATEGLEKALAGENNRQDKPEMRQVGQIQETQELRNSW